MEGAVLINELTPDIRWLDDPEVFRVKQLPAHSDHKIYASEQEAEEGKSSLVQSLDGTWKFCYSGDIRKRPKDFYKEDYDTSAFDEITVPCHIEMAGYGRLHYINTMYPWEGTVYRRPAYTSAACGMESGCFSEAADNAAGSYVRRFDLDEGLRGKRVCICFDGVEQAAYVWLNGQFVGYMEDSFTPSEFDLTPYIKDTDNVLAVEVFKRSTAAFLEDQDFFRFFGIFRSVSLYAKPELHVEDLWVMPYLHEDNKSGSLEIRIKISNRNLNAGNLHMALTDRQGQTVGERNISLQNTEENDICFKKPDLENISPWEHHSPYLYKLNIVLSDENGTVEAVPYEIGFRRIEIKDNIMLLNGKRLIINGVNRHEWSAESGRCITEQEMEWDIACMKKNHINAVRTCHYPDQKLWYELCDKAGIYVMSETNLESHGSWQKAGAIEPSWNVPGSVNEWKEAVLDRARTNFECFKNHPSVLFWSLGNESYAGDVLAEMNRFFKETDALRLVHYEGVANNRKYEDEISDVESRMYAYPKDVIEYLENDPKKPYLLCEYMHDMGNSLGGMKTYMDFLDRYPMYQGGFIWDYIDQALFVEDEITGKKILRYGGDFDDRPSDYEFSGNGILFADRTEKPAMQEVRYYYGTKDYCG